MGKEPTVDELLHELELYIENGNRSGAIIKATEVIEKEPDNVEALWALLELGLPERRRDGSYRIDPSLPEAAKGWALSRRIVDLDPTHRGAWFRGAILATQHLGLAEEVLQWWDDYRSHHPTDIIPIIEQAALLIRMGFYAQASQRLEQVLENGMEEMTRDQLIRVERMNRTIQRYYEMMCLLYGYQPSFDLTADLSEEWIDDNHDRCIESYELKFDGWLRVLDPVLR